MDTRRKAGHAAKQSPPIRASEPSGTEAHDYGSDLTGIVRIRAGIARELVDELLFIERTWHASKPKCALPFLSEATGIEIASLERRSRRLFERYKNWAPTSADYPADLAGHLDLIQPLGVITCGLVAYCHILMLEKAGFSIEAPPTYELFRTHLLEDDRFETLRPLNRLDGLVFGQQRTGLGPLPCLYCTPGSAGPR